MLAADVVISEIFYQPAGNATNERQDEWVEVYNAGDADANLRGWTLSAVPSTGAAESVLYSRPNTPAGNFILRPGEYAIIAANINRHVGVPINKKMGNLNPANWSGSASLDNAGGSVILRDNSVTPARLIARVDYLDEAPWPVFADGFGASLRIIDPLELFNPADLSGGRYDAENWTWSIQRGGSPAAAGMTTGPGVVFNEILASSNDNAVPPELDRIELYNTTDATVDISNWFLTDHDNTAEGTATAAELQRYVFPAGTTIAPHGYLVVDENQFGAGTNGFRLNGTDGDQVLLVKTTVPAGMPVLYSDAVAFEPSEESVSYGRIPAGQGPLIPNESQTFGGENSGHKQSDVVISEIMYQPPSDNPFLEFIELFNRGTENIDLYAPAVGTAGWRFRADIDFDFPIGTTLAPNERLIIVPFNPVTDAVNRTLFENTYGVKLNAGTGTVVKAVGGHADDMSNNNGDLELQERVLVGLNDFGQPVYDFIQRDFVHYEDSGDWPGRADGLGASLERIDPSLYANSAESWRGSFEYNGTPGTAPNPGKTVVINEVLSHTDPPYFDSVELYNTSSEPVDISNWWVAEDLLPLDLNPVIRLTIPAGTILPPGGYITFNNDASRPNRFNFGLDGAEGGNVYLLQTVNDRIVRFADNIGYPASFNVDLAVGTSSLGRWPNGTGTMFPMQSITLKNSFDPVGPGQIYMDGVNSGPRIGDIDRTIDPSDVVISEVMYNAGNVEGADSLEYIELYNPTNLPIDLGPLSEPDSDQWLEPPRGWRFNKAVDYEFKAGEVIPAQGTILVVGFDPADATKLAAFQARYGLTGTERIVGPFANGEHISDYGGNIELEANDFAQGTLPAIEKFTPSPLVDGVRYDNDAPWPAGAAGGGQSLTRVLPAAFGDFPASWVAAAPTPGSVGPPVPSSAPQVSKVVVWGNGWSQEFKTEISDPGTVGITGYTIPGGATQSTVLPWTGIDRISVIFSEDVEIDSDALAVRGVTTANYLAGSSPTYNASTWTATWQLSQPIGRDRILLDLLATSVRDIEGNDLDGEWTDGVSSYPSGNATEGGDFEMRFNVLPGDVDRNGTVGQDDFSDLRTALFVQVGNSGYDEFRDISGNGKIAVQDWVLLRNQLGQSLPSGSPSPEPGPAPGQAAAALVLGRPTSGQGTERLAAARIRGARQTGLAAGAVDRAFTLQASDESSSASPSRLRARANRSPREGTDNVMTGVGSP
jgi:hypothetical protein